MDYIIICWFSQLNNGRLAGETGLALIELTRNALLARPSMENLNCHWQFKPIGSNQFRLAKQNSLRTAGCFVLAGETGLEPATNGFGDRYSTN